MWHRRALNRPDWETRPVTEQPAKIFFVPDLLTAREVAALNRLAELKTDRPR
jgi:hypothetical protein